MFCIVCHKYPTVADKASRGFRLDSLVSHEKSHSYYFCFQRAKNEKPEQAPRQRISRKIDEESKEKLLK